jgi:hypothetical protein
MRQRWDDARWARPTIDSRRERDTDCHSGGFMLLLQLLLRVPKYVVTYQGLNGA